MDSDAIRDQLNLSFYNTDSSDSVPSIFRDLSDPNDPSVNFAEYDYYSDDSRTGEPNLNQMDISEDEVHSSLTETRNKLGNIKKKPSTVLEYNKGKSFIDVSDQLASYGTSVRRGLKWYRKVMFELLTNTAIVNAHSLYKSTVLAPVDIVTFREELVTYLLVKRLGLKENDENLRVDHRLKTLDDRPRGRCTSCYERLQKSLGRLQASKTTPQVRTKCEGCPDQKYMCMDCFFKKHRCVKK